MSRRPIRKIIGLALTLLLSIACGLVPTPTPPSTAWQSTVDDLSALQSGLEFPDHFEDENATRTGEEFEVNEYFSVLDRLSMEPGYVLDYVYCYDGMGGYPRLYARPEDQPRLLTCSDYDGSTNYLDHVQADDTEEGFFQFVLLQVVAGQFYLFWHAGYYDDVVICDRDTIDSIVSEAGGFGQPFSAEQKRAARAIDPAPIVELGDEVVTVKIVTFSNWGGFTQETYEINRSFPHTILDSDSEVLVEYDCGIMF
jgi:hypothetical protein